MSLQTSYLGLTLKNPIMIGSSPLSHSLDSIKRAEDAGAAGVCLASLFEEQINYEQEELDYYLHFGSESFAEALSYFPNIDDYAYKGVDNYLKLISDAKEGTDIAVIPSINGVSRGGWIDYAKTFEEAGADAVELNIYYVSTNPALPANKIEDMYLDTIRAVKRAVSIPIAVKIGPFFSSFANFAAQAVGAGANSLVLFNRFYGPEIDLDTFDITSSLHLSHNEEIQLALRWIALLSDSIKADFAATSGIQTSGDVVRTVLAGASSCQIASLFLKRGVDHISVMLKEISEWLSKNEFETLEEIRGKLSYRSINYPAAYERANYMKALQGYQSTVA